MAGRFWLLKSDPDTFSFADLERSPRRTTCWDGVRNYQARNYLRDEIREGDDVLFYHSQEDKAVVGTATVASAGYPDPTQFDPASKGHDPDSDRSDPTWYAVDLRFERRFAHPVTLGQMRETPGLEEMVLLRKGSRLSVQPVTASEWKIVEALGKGASIRSAGARPPSPRR
jgi:predicted RNA-binding protein with PUA-like domain